MCLFRVSLRLATSESWRDRNTGERQQRTEWHRIIFYGRRAETAGQYLKKGSQIYVEGSIRTNKYTDKNGIERYSTDINANEMQMLGGNQSGQQGGSYGNRGSNSGNRGGFGGQDSNQGFDDSEDDIPF